MTVGTKAPNDWGIYDMLGNGREFVLDTVDNSAWKGTAPVGDLLGKGVLIYKKAETDPLRFADAVDVNLWGPLLRGTPPAINGGWCEKRRCRSFKRFGTGATFRLVIGPDLLKERGIKLPDLGK